MLKKILKIFLAFSSLIFIIAVAYIWQLTEKIKTEDPLLWESEIQAFEAYDDEFGFPTKAILFAGSSSVETFDDLEELMKPHDIIRRGFGGAQINDVVFYQNQLIDKYAASKIVLYIGPIDAYYLNRDHPDYVVQKLHTLLIAIRQTNPEAEILYIAPRPPAYSPEVCDDFLYIGTEMSKFEMNNYRVIDANNSVKDAQGNYRKDLYKIDRMHLNAEGNALWWGEIKKQIIN